MALNDDDGTSWQVACSSCIKARCLRFYAAWLCKAHDSGLDRSSGQPVKLLQPVELLPPGSWSNAYLRVL